MIEELASRAFQARNIAHRAHWASKSYAEHVALGAFYDDVIEAVDSIVEEYQGLYATRLDAFIVKDMDVKDLVDYLTAEADWIEENREDISQGSPSIQNLIDNLTSVYTKTVFLLSLK
jgi:hypothetical protein